MMVAYKLKVIEYAKTHSNREAGIRVHMVDCSVRDRSRDINAELKKKIILLYIPILGKYTFAV